MSAKHKAALLPHLVQTCIRFHELWTDVDWRRGHSDDQTGEFVDDSRQITKALEQAEAISSRTMHSTGQVWHRPMIDLDMEAAIVPSSTAGHCHLYINKELSWDDYEKLLTVMAEVGLVELGYVAASRKRQCTFLRLPWIRKGHERENQPFPNLEAVEEFLGAPRVPSDPMATGSPGAPPF